jgi:hypothetical protein
VTTCSSVPVDMAVHALASLGDMGTSCAGQCKALLGRWLAPPCLVEEGQPPGHGEVGQGREERGMAW